MSKPLLASIIITSYNYEPFLKDAINSALNQTYPHTEVIVVDDQSTDNSREIILSYKNRIISVLKKNGGQGSAFNEGFKVSQGEVIFFLDSDDILLPTAVSTAISFFQDPDVAKVHWPLRVIDGSGKKQDRVVPSQPLSQGDLKDALLRYGPGGYVWQVTSGNAWAKRFIQSIFPMPEAEYKTCPDLYLHALAPLFGTVKRISHPQGLWRIHGNNYSWHLPFDRRLSFQVRLWEHCFEALKKYCRAIDRDIDIEVFRANSWWHQVELAIQEIAAVIPMGNKLILVDDSYWQTDEILAGCQRFHFLEREGQYWGYPADDETAIFELQRLRSERASFIVFPWSSFWWLNYYSKFHDYLRSEYQCLLENKRLVIFNLRP
ncbi:MAG: glycosyltransferase family 2 protein [Xenococcus sp. MO_188.B8]|nr:glycosyltransferase family 2 protein [Xenococcus sp. MO_188.B8]